jgi:type IV secretion system protein TrbC
MRIFARPEFSSLRHRAPRLAAFLGEPGFWRAAAVGVALFAAAPARADSPWENAVTVLQTAFTGTIARGLSLVAIVVGGLMFAFGEGESKRMLAGIVFGVGMAIGAVNFIAWLFP